MTLLERDPKAPAAWLGDLPVTSRYTYGLAGERFFRKLKDEGRIYGTYCYHCKRTYVPPMLYCERCLAELDHWLDVGLTGEVHTFTVLFKNYDGSERQDPEVIAFVRFGDGGLVHRVSEINPDEIEIGMVVEAVLKSADERIGSILDIEYFRPVV